MLFPLWPLILSTYDFYVPFLKIYNFVLMSCTISEFLNFHVSHLNYEKFNLCLQNTLKMLKTTRVYFGMLHDNFPSNYYEVKKILCDLGLDYKKIYACPQNCMLFIKENANADKCNICGTSRWKNVKYNSTDGLRTCSKGKKISTKVLRHFPLIPRLQRLFMSSKTTSYMTWHA